MRNAILMASATEIQNNFGRYLQYAIDQGEVIILRNGKRVARIISEETTVGFLTESLRGVLKQQYTDEDVKSARCEKYDVSSRGNA